MHRIVGITLSMLVAGLASSVAGAQTETVRYYHSDAIGSVRMVTDEAGQVIQRYDYWPFGVPTEMPVVAESRRFAGKERDADTRFDYFGARDYQSLLGRFNTVDPVLPVDRAMMNPQRWNRYAYVSNNPMRNVDPTGGYEIDVHLYLTQELARAAGIDGAVADRIGVSNQRIDENSATGPFGSRAARQDYHFTSEGRRQELWRAFMQSGSPEDLGVFFHAQQDASSHAGYGPTLGHLLAGSSPDRTFSAPDLADAMARDTYDRLRAAGLRLGKSGGSALPWEKVEPYVTRFNRATTLEEKREVLWELRQASEGR